MTTIDISFIINACASMLAAIAQLIAASRRRW